MRIADQERKYRCRDLMSASSHDGVFIDVHVIPRARKSEIAGTRAMRCSCGSTRRRWTVRPTPSSLNCWRPRSRSRNATSRSSPASDPAPSGCGSRADGRGRERLLKPVQLKMASNQRKFASRRLRCVARSRCGASSAQCAGAAAVRRTGDRRPGACRRRRHAAPARARHVSAGTSRPDPVLTDNDGRFSVEVPGGGIAPFTLTITKGGFVTATASVPRKDAQAPLLVRLPRGAAISGIVVDSSGAPVVAMAVTASRIAGAQACAPQRNTPRPQTTSASIASPACREAVTKSGRARPSRSSPASRDTAREGRVPAAGIGRLPAGAKTAVTVETAEDVSGVQLTAPAESAAEAHAEDDAATGEVRQFLGLNHRGR